MIDFAVGDEVWVRATIWTIDQNTGIITLREIPWGQVPANLVERRHQAISAAVAAERERAAKMLDELAKRTLGIFRGLLSGTGKNESATDQNH